MKCKYYIISISLLILSVKLDAQYIGKRWTVVQELGDKVVYLDTTSIRYMENQISLWSLEVYNTPQNIQPLTRPVSHVKTQYLINNITRRYSIIGALFYDEQGRIIGESSTPRPVGGRDNFSIPIQENTSLEVLLNKAQSYISSGNLDSTVDDLSPDQISFDSKLHEEVSQKLNNYSPFDSLTADRSDEIVKSESESDIVTGNQVIQNSQQPLQPNRNSDIVVLKNTQDKSTDDVRKENTSTFQPTKPSTTTGSISGTASYNNANERNVSSTIFTDGNLFCFQVSSWRQKSIAESEAQKLRSRGHNAFVVEAYIPQKGGTWYRVRIGYFNSEEEAKEYMRRM